MKISSEKLVVIGSLIALELSEGKSLDEINTYRNLFNVIACNLQAIVNQELYNKKQDKK